MKAHTAGLGLALALLSSALPAAAADLGLRESYRSMGVPAAIPVPAPIPVPNYRSTWYFRLDAALGLISDPDVSGSIDNLVGLPGDSSGPYGLSLPSWFDTDFNTFLTLGAGVGYSFNNGWRLDGTVEKRSKDDVFGNNIDAGSYDTWQFNAGNYEMIDAPTNGIADTQTRYLVSESANIDGTIWMLSAYYDFARGGAFTPYIGGGVGFAWNEVSRTQTIRTQTCDNDPPVGATDCASGTYSAPSTHATATNKSDTVSLAAAAMAGFSYDLTDITSVDIGYRYLFIGGTSSSMNIGGAESTLDIGDQHVHQVRAGLRFNVN